jgi:hypothetical protein
MDVVVAEANDKNLRVIAHQNFLESSNNLNQQGKNNG